jgi:AcrR family transcriptional regulator
MNISIEKQKLVIDAALEEFILHGYENASTNRLAKTLGIAKGSIFKYFSSKEHLFTHLLELSLSALKTHMNSYNPESGNPVKELLKYAELEYDFLIDHPKYYHFFYRVQSEMGKEWFKPYEKLLIEESILLSNALYEELNVSFKLRDHVSLVIGAYNQRFMANVTLETDYPKVKKEYLFGLEEHLDLIKWR